MENNQKTFLYGILALLIGFGGWYGYTYFVGLNKGKSGPIEYSNVTTANDQKQTEIGQDQGQVDIKSPATQEDFAKLTEGFLQGRLVEFNNQFLKIDGKENLLYQIKINDSTEYLKFSSFEQGQKRIETKRTEFSALKVGQILNINLDESTLSDPTPLATRIAIK